MPLGEVGLHVIYTNIDNVDPDNGTRESWSPFREGLSETMGAPFLVFWIARDFLLDKGFKTCDNYIAESA